MQKGADLAARPFLIAMIPCADQKRVLADTLK